MIAMAPLVIALLLGGTSLALAQTPGIVPHPNPMAMPATTHWTISHHKQIYMSANTHNKTRKTGQRKAKQRD